MFDLTFQEEENPEKVSETLDVSSPYITDDLILNNIKYKEKFNVGNLIPVEARGKSKVLESIAKNMRLNT